MITLRVLCCRPTPISFASHHRHHPDHNCQVSLVVGVVEEGGSNDGKDGKDGRKGSKTEVVKKKVLLGKDRFESWEKGIDRGSWPSLEGTLLRPAAHCAGQD